MLEFDPGFFDDSRWPVLSLRLPGTLSSPGQEACLARLEEYLRQSEKFLVITDLQGVGMVPLEQRWRQVEWFEEHDALLRERVVGSAVILTSPLVRLSISAILYFKRVPLPIALVARRQEAEAWAAERLREAGLAQAIKRP